ncbi:MAG: hypothetical protein Q9205_003508 [Flavoplaca limonia]
MDWDGWSGFQGEGTYVILNRKSLLSLQMDHHGEISTGAHIPNDLTQLWQIRKGAGWNIYVLENFEYEDLMVVKGVSQQVVGGRPINQCVKADEDFHKYLDEEAHWAIDMDKHALEPGKMVTFRNCNAGLESTDLELDIPVDEFIEGGSYDVQVDALWVVDKSICALEPGKKVV